MRIILRWRIGLAMLLVLRAVLASVPREMRPCMPANVAWRPRCSRTWESCSPRRTGQPDGLVRAGDVILTGIEFFPPIRPLTRTAFGTVSYAGRITLCVNSDPTAFSRDDGDRLLGSLIRGSSLLIG